MWHGQPDSGCPGEARTAGHGTGPGAPMESSPVLRGQRRCPESKPSSPVLLGLQPWVGLQVSVCLSGKGRAWGAAGSPALPRHPLPKTTPWIETMLLIKLRGIPSQNLLISQREACALRPLRPLPSPVTHSLPARRLFRFHIRVHLQNLPSSVWLRKR